ncbi:hypothetical protein M2322_003534 [Rhodoblastus acidophilus]|uniref:hypothetical protein n=1 Tax=Rhodoblastus acidophilus TaxID=1074 RepID=UPI0022246100|nr:hypothetical protein [Rhodoblastus acidophilus]MCW2317969.1 hypothetical protein [Rhodoblastus acidophilus]
MCDARLIEIMARGVAHRVCGNADAATGEKREPLWTFYVRDARAALDALRAEGMEIVPREPTEAMMEAGEGAFFTTYTGTATATPDDVYRLMLAAAKEPAP